MKLGFSLLFLFLSALPVAQAGSNYDAWEIVSRWKISPAPDAASVEIVRTFLNNVISNGLSRIALINPEAADQTLRDQAACSHVDYQVWKFQPKPQ